MAVPRAIPLRSGLDEIFLTVSAARYGGIPRDTAGYCGILGDTGRYTGRYEIRGERETGGKFRGNTGRDTGRYGQRYRADTGADTGKCGEIRGDRGRYGEIAQKIVQTRARAQREARCPPRRGRTLRQHCRSPWARVVERADLSLAAGSNHGSNCDTKVGTRLAAPPPKVKGVDAGLTEIEGPTSPQMVPRLAAKTATRPRLVCV